MAGHPGQQPAAGELAFSEGELADELVRMFPPKPRRLPGDVDATQMSKLWGTTFEVSRARLKKLVSEGKLVEIEALDKGHNVKVYRELPRTP